MHNAYFKVKKPFRVFRHIGHSATNTWAGASRAIATVMEAINTRPGDEIHALVGGTFMIRDGQVSALSLSAPKPLFEKSYSCERDEAKLRARIKHGETSEIPKPASDIDYNVAGRKVEANRLPDLHQEIVEIERSPQMEEMEEVVAGFLVDLEGLDIRHAYKAMDIHAHGGPDFHIRPEGSGPVTVKAGARGIIVVDLPAGAPVGRFSSTRDPGEAVHVRLRADPASDTTIFEDLSELLSGYARSLDTEPAPAPRI